MLRHQGKYRTNGEGNQDNSRQSAHTKMGGGSTRGGGGAAYSAPAPQAQTHGIQLLKSKTLSRANSGLVCPDEWRQDEGHVVPNPQGLPVATVPGHTNTVHTDTLVRANSTLVRANSGLSCGLSCELSREDDAAIVKRPVSLGERLPRSPGYSPHSPRSPEYLARSPALLRVSKTLVRANSGLSVAEVCDGVEPSSNAAPASQLRRREHTFAGRTVMRGDSGNTLLRSNSGLSVQVDED